MNLPYQANMAHLRNNHEYPGNLRELTAKKH